MNRRSCVGCLLSLAVLAGMFPVLGCGGGKFATPEATFEAAKTAGKNKDWKGYCECLTPESVDAMAGMMVFSGSMMKQFAPLAALAGKEKAEEMKQLADKVGDVLKQHGVTEEAMKNSAPVPGKKFDAGAMAKLAEPVKDKQQFLADMMEVLQAAGDKKQDFTGNIAEATLKDVKIDGEKATATVVAEGREQPLHFKNVSGEWKIDFIESLASLPTAPAPAIPPGSGPPSGTDFPSIPKTPQ